MDITIPCRRRRKETAIDSIFRVSGRVRVSSRHRQQSPSVVSCAFKRGRAVSLSAALVYAVGRCLAQQVLPGTQPLPLEGDLSAQMVAGIDRFLLRQTAASISNRPSYWHRDFSSAAAYDNSI